MAEKYIQMKCPHCSFQVKAELKLPFKKFLLYVCPGCKRNVVFYNGKMGIISSTLVKSLIKRKILQVCGDALFTSYDLKNQKISEDDIINLKILLETEQDFDKIIAKL
jgi:DNA-directed RNA polymerase subunit RPC12/RpoP